jgi:hypothetical protein
MGEHEEEKAVAASEETGEITDEVLQKVAGEVHQVVNFIFN